MIIEYKKEGRIAIFTINRPQALNAMNPAGLAEFRQALIEFRDDPGVWVGIITGAGGRAFCAGADIKETLPVMKAGQELPATILRGMEVYKPLIAAVNGMALGGGLEFALACDIRIAAENARFGSTEALIGLIPGWGATQRLPRLIPAGKAAEMMFTGKIIDAAEAYRVGLVNAVVPPDKLMETARQYAADILKAAPLAVRAVKEAMVRGADTTLEEGLRIELDLEYKVLQTADFSEGVAAFSEKRKAEYKGI